MNLRVDWYRRVKRRDAGVLRHTILPFHCDASAFQVLKHSGADSLLLAIIIIDTSNVMWILRYVKSYHSNHKSSSFYVVE